MRKIISTAIFFCLTLLAIGQQEQQNTQFMYYKTGYNPAAAGSGQGNFTAIYRDQWRGIEGAPKTQILSFDMPFSNQKVGVGINILRNSIGISESYTTNAMYAYKMKFHRGLLGIGLQGSFRSLANDYNKTTAIQEKERDESIPKEKMQKFIFNFGAGIFYKSENFYFGVSIPRFLKNNIDFSDDNIIISREVNHYYIMSGIVFKLSDNIKLQPQVLLKYVKNVPLDADINLTFLLLEKFYTGLTYRLGGSSTTGFGESLDVLLGGQITSNILFGASYDITLSDLKDYTSGSMEAIVRYSFGKKEDNSEYINPRFF